MSCFKHGYLTFTRNEVSNSSAALSRSTYGPQKRQTFGAHARTPARRSGSYARGARQALKRQAGAVIDAFSVMWAAPVLLIAAAAATADASNDSEVQCGVPRDIQSRIVGGSRARLGEAPWQVSSIRRHPKFGTDGANHDIALLKLVEPFDFVGSDGYVAPVCLPDKYHRMEGSVTITGWGKTRESGKISQDLHVVTVPVGSDLFCTYQYSQLITLSSLYDRRIMFCARALLGGRGSCKGAKNVESAKLTSIYCKQHRKGLLEDGMHCTKNSHGWYVICKISPSREAGDYSIYAGVHKLSLDNAQKQVRQGLKRFAHKGFRLRTFRNDIGLLKLDSPVDIAGSEGYINTVCLPPKGFKIKDDIVIAGWGTTRESGFTSDVLQAVSVPSVGDRSCYYRYLSFWSLIFGGNIHYDSMFCAGERRGGKDSCQGDSGGPAVQYVDGQAVLVGIVSWGEGCARAGKPGVYTEVSYFLDWIREQMASSPDEEEKKPSTSAPTRTSENTETSGNAQTRTSENTETRSSDAGTAEPRSTEP
ncbi:hypothetical protein HPB51_009602 [Rhipicephalus microplus]|uniref:Vitamin K-dependent protein C n=1 Tax=Rhipicephalus microplus TaxID=6941 RepID=A0A9J6DM42_RHIMP|nr:hypothetical protein HPB51_009602 [Rhipicephalus microplus]